MIFLKCGIPALFLLLNNDGSVLARIHNPKLPDPHIDAANELCVRKVGTCAHKVAIFPSGHIYVSCQRRKSNEK